MKQYLFFALLMIFAFDGFYSSAEAFEDEGLDPDLDIIVDGVSVQRSSFTHEVVAGESLSLIAERYGSSTAVLLALNDLNDPNMIYVGQSLSLPDGAKDGELDSVEVVYTTYIVRPGDILSAIAEKHQLSVADLLSYNPQLNPDLLWVGELIKILPKESSPNSDDTDLPNPLSFEGEKRIVVDLSEQRSYVYLDGALMYKFVVSTGEWGRETAVGSYQIQNKIPVAYAYTWGLEMAYWMGIYWAGALQNGFHALPIMNDGTVLWDGYLGTPVSYGCVILSQEDAALLYAFADVGTEVVIQP